MKRYFSSVALRSSGSAEQPVNDHARPSNSELRAMPSQLSILTIADVQRWLAQESTASYRSVELQRTREAVAVLTSCNKLQPQMVDARALLGSKKWNAAVERDQNARVLSDMVQEGKGKGTQAEQKLQQQPPDIAPLLASRTAEQSAPLQAVRRLQSASSCSEDLCASVLGQSAHMDTIDGVDTDGDPMRARIRANQRKRAQNSAAEEQRPLAKPKATRGRKKQAAAITLDSAEQSAPKRRNRMFTSDLLALNAHDAFDPSAVSIDSAEQSSPVLQQRQAMWRLLYELRKLSICAWVVDDAEKQRRAIIPKLCNLQILPATQKILRQRPMSALYTSICGSLQPLMQTSQDYTHVSMAASFVVERQALQCVQAIDEIQESRMLDFPYLWKLKKRQNDAVVNGLPGMPKSHHELFENLKDTGVATITPFGLLPTGEQAPQPLRKCPEYFLRMLACLEMPNLRPLEDLPTPGDHTGLINRVVQHRAAASEQTDGDGGRIASGDIKQTLQDFCNDPFSAYAKKRWLCDVLKVPKEKRDDPDYLPQIFSTAVDEFLQELASAHTNAPQSKHTLAVLALYHRFLITWKKKSTGPMKTGPVLRILANVGGNSRKQYLPQNQCGENVELAANCMPAYYRRMQNSAGQPVEDLSLPVASPPVMCWICGEGFLHNDGHCKHWGEAHGDYAQYRKLRCGRAQEESATFHLT